MADVDMVWTYIDPGQDQLSHGERQRRRAGRSGACDAYFVGHWRTSLRDHARAMGLARLNVLLAPWVSAEPGRGAGAAADAAMRAEPDAFYAVDMGTRIMWFFGGVLHRPLDAGPAVISIDGCMEWWDRGEFRGDAPPPSVKRAAEPPPATAAPTTQDAAEH